MPKIVFAGLSVLTQGAAALQQLLLLPLLLFHWGKADTAEWFAVVSFSMLASVADLGMRSLGHAELRRLESDPDPAVLRRFLSVWSWTRLFVPLVALLLCIAALLWTGTHSDGQIWPLLLILAAGLETLLIVRIIYLDTVGLYVASEGVYAGFAVTRLVLLMVVALVFGPDKLELAAIFLATVIAALLAQEMTIAGRRHLSLFAPLALDRQDLKAIPYALAEPAANWVRLSLPVLVLFRFAVPETVAVFVGLRAIFALVRSTVSQISRVVSVEYLQSAARSQSRADAGLVLALAGMAIIGGGVGATVIVDHGRLLALWLGPLGEGHLQLVSLYFAVTAPFYGHQAMLSILLRIGRWRSVGRLMIGYGLASLAIAALCLAFGGVTLYLIAASLIEIGIGLGCFWAMQGVADPKAMRKSAAIAVATAAVCSVWWLTVVLAPGLFEINRPSSWAWTLAALLLSGAALTGGVLLTSRTEVRSLREQS